MLTEYTWAVVVGAIFCFTLGAGMGANDVANNFGTSVGSRSISLRGALVIAAIFELIGSVGLGASVTDAVRKGVYYPERFGELPDFLLIANLTTLLTVTVWLFVASSIKMSVSTTHSMIGSFMGCGLAISPQAVHWAYLGQVVIAWFAAPALSMITAACFYVLIRKFILRNGNPVSRGELLLPFLVLYVCGIIAIYLVFNNPVVMSNKTCRQKVDGKIVDISPCKLTQWVSAHLGTAWGIAIGASFALALIFYWPLRWWIHRSMINDERIAEDAKLAALMAMEEDSQTASRESAQSADEDTEDGEQTGCKIRAKQALANAPWNRDIHAEAEEDNENVHELAVLTEKFDWRGEAYFKALQTVSAALACLVHGSNDVSNAAAPFSSIYSIYKEGAFLDSVAVPIWVLVLGGSSISIGLMTLGYKVIQTVGIELLHMSAPKGFSVEMSIFTITIICSFLGFSISSTHIGVGAMIGVGLMDRHIDPETGEDITQKTLGYLNFRAINWPLAGKLAVSWVGTIILCALGSYLIFSFAIHSPTKVARFIPCLGQVVDNQCVTTQDLSPFLV
ncbi:putative phosphate transporter [Gregarina niphandrodes]|uniref:Phosphate transporter n=1 Tax=Gregarina niphandrodes TaxID=110365 RepID=A0A023B1U5_GRENI|nr:putative phosphate transporter [Gregarina niphandrodes]EZG46757.1 putative phosphate transporter [Gregarina niphandrodes]|eukprot:XP_011132266.1 putative phosphate transporter [Gregarina niphandrodes]